MKKNLVIAFFVCSTFALALVVLVSRPANRDSRAEAAAGPGVAAEAPPKAPPAANANAVNAPTPAEPAPALLAELTTLRTENARLEKLVRDLQSEVSILNARRTPAPSISTASSTLPQLPQRVLAELLGNKETVGLAMDWIKADQSRRYASLIALANLDDATEAQLRDLLAERYATRLDVAAVGLESVTAEQRRQFDADFSSRLEKIVGADIAALFAKAEGKPISFERIQRLEDRLRYEASPLTREQYLPLWELMSSQVFYAAAPRTEADYQAIFQRQTDGALHIGEEARKILAPDQLKVLMEMMKGDLTIAQIQMLSTIQALRQRQAAGGATTGTAP